MTDISVIFPSRNRAHIARDSILSIDQSTEVNVEFLIGTDPDEVMDYTGLKDIADNVHIIEFTQRHGYAKLHEYYNTLAELSTGRWIWLWNDDCELMASVTEELMRSGGYLARDENDWAEWLMNQQEQCVVNPCRGNHEPPLGQTFFPIFPRAYVEITGHVSLNAHNDTWIQEVVHPLGRLINVPICVLHNRADVNGENNDKVFAEGRANQQADDFWSPQQAEQRDLDRGNLVRAGWYPL